MNLRGEAGRSETAELELGGLRHQDSNLEPTG